MVPRNPVDGAVDQPVYNEVTTASRPGRPRRGGDRLVAFKDRDTALVSGRDGLPLAVRAGERLPSGARLLGVDREGGAIETDLGILQLE